MLDRMYKKRLKTYAKLGYEAIGDTVGANVDPNSNTTGRASSSGTRVNDLDASQNAGKADEAASSFVNAKAFFSLFSHDIAQASRSIQIAAPYANAAMIRTLTPLLENAVARNLEVSCLIGKASDEHNAAAALVDSGCHVKFDPTAPTGFAVFDGMTVWYGSLPLLDYPHTDDCSLRFISAEVAHAIAQR